MKTLFLAWRDPETRRWFPVGKLQYVENYYRFEYVRGALEARKQGGFCPFPSFPNMNEAYVSEVLFPLFSNRTLPRSRPDYKEYVQWLNFPKDEADPLTLLARSGGKRATDTLEVFPCPEKDSNGQYHIHFFAHGLRHMSQCAQDRVGSLRPEERLRLLHDFQNEHDARALMLRTNETTTGDYHLVGYCPSYLTEDIFELVQKNYQDFSNAICVRVERVNPVPAPTQLRLLCNMTVRWPDGFEPFSSAIYQSLVLKQQ
jgi:hypothetical protein